MSLVSIEVFKEHIRGGDDAAEGVVLQAYLDGAEDVICQHLGRRIIAADATPSPGSHELPLPPAITAAILLMAGHLYANREGVVTGTIATALPLSVQFLLSPYRVWLPTPGTA